MIDWKPGETAPKDGTRILACVNERGIRDVFIVQWDSGEQYEPEHGIALCAPFTPAWLLSEAEDEWFDTLVAWAPLPLFVQATP